MQAMLYFLFILLHFLTSSTNVLSVYILHIRVAVIAREGRVIQPTNFMVVGKIPGEYEYNKILTR